MCIATVYLLTVSHAILVHIRRVNLEEHGAKVDTVRYSPVNLVGQDSTKSVHIQYAFKFTSEYSDLSLL